MTKDEYTKCVGMAIRERRESLNYAQDKFAFSNSIDRGYYWKIEHGKINISVWQLCLFANRLETTPYELLKRANEIANIEAPTIS